MDPVDEAAPQVEQFSDESLAASFNSRLGQMSEEVQGPDSPLTGATLSLTLYSRNHTSITPESGRLKQHACRPTAEGAGVCQIRQDV